MAGCEDLLAGCEGLLAECENLLAECENFLPSCETFLEGYEDLGHFGSAAQSFAVHIIIQQSRFSSLVKTRKQPSLREANL